MVARSDAGRSARVLRHASFDVSFSRSRRQAVAGELQLCWFLWAPRTLSYALDILGGWLDLFSSRDNDGYAASGNRGQRTGNISKPYREDRRYPSSPRHRQTPQSTPHCALIVQQQDRYVVVVVLPSSKELLLRKLPNCLRSTSFLHLLQIPRSRGGQGSRIKLSLLLASFSISKGASPKW